MDAQYHGAVLPGLLVQRRAMTHSRTSAAVGVLNLMLPAETINVLWAAALLSATTMPFI